MRIACSILSFLLWAFPVALHGQPEKNLDSLLVDAATAIEKAEYETSFDLFLQCLAQAEKEGRKDRLPIIYYNLGLIQHLNKVYDKSLVYLNKAVESARLNHDSVNIARSLLMQGIIHFYLNQLDSSVTSIESSAAMYSAIGEKARASFAISKIGNILEANGKFKEATPYFLQQLKDAQEANDSLSLLSATINMATNNLNLESYPKGLEYIRSAKSLAKQLGREFEYKESLMTESMLLEKGGRPAEAVTVLREYLVVQDSFLNSERSQQIAELETRFETDKKEAVIHHQESALRWNRLALMALAGFLLLALIAGFLLYRLTRQLRKRNAEKELLVKEIHHRVKNNLQILSSLLYLQSRQIQDSAALEAVREGQNRVEAMSLIHQKLYMGDNLAHVDMPNYLKELSETLLESFGMLENGRVKIHQRIDPIQLDVDTAIPVGLIANELITNALKYAFPHGKTGTVEVVLQKQPDNSLFLEVGDDGAGMAPEGNASPASFGTRLVQMLSQKLNGKQEVVAQEQGYRVRIHFTNIHAR